MYDRPQSTFLDSLLNLLMDLYLSNHSSLLMKTAALHELKSLCKRANCLSLAPTSGAKSHSFESLSILNI